MYIDLQLLIHHNKWILHLFTIEVGARGFVAKSTIKMFRALGFSHIDTSKIAKDLMEIAARCSYAIYVARECAHWDPKKPLLQIASADKREDSAVKAPSSLSPSEFKHRRPKHSLFARDVLSLLCLMPALLTHLQPIKRLKIAL